MNDSDTPARVRRVVARLGEDAAESRFLHVVATLDGGVATATLPAHATRLLAAAPALIRLAEAVGRLFEAEAARDALKSRTWLTKRGPTRDELAPYVAPIQDARHAIDAALADMAALAGDDAGEVGAWADKPFNVNDQGRGRFEEQGPRLPAGKDSPHA